MGILGYNIEYRFMIIQVLNLVKDCLFVVALCFFGGGGGCVGVVLWCRLCWFVGISVGGAFVLVGILEIVWCMVGKLC